MFLPATLTKTAPVAFSGNTISNSATSPTEISIEGTSIVVINFSTVNLLVLVAKLCVLSPM